VPPILAIIMSAHGRTNSTQSVNGRRIHDDGLSTVSSSSGEEANGTSAVLKGHNRLQSSDDRASLSGLQEELERTKAEKEALEGQYRTLLDRLSEMKSKIGLKLQQDAVSPLVHSLFHSECLISLNQFSLRKSSNGAKRTSPPSHPKTRHSKTR